MSFTLAVEGDPAIHRVQLRNGVLIISTVETAEQLDVSATRDQLAEFVLGVAALPGDAPELAGFGDVFDRSQFLPRESLVAMLGSKSWIMSIEVSLCQSDLDEILCVHETHHVCSSGDPG